MVNPIGRGLWIGITRTRDARCDEVAGVGAARGRAFGTGFRATEYNIRNSNVIDVGYSGVIGAERIVHGEWPYGHMPEEGTLKACGPTDPEGEIRERIQTNGRCESANPRGDTYGPVAYESYIPGYLALGWSGQVGRPTRSARDRIAFDLLCILGLALVGLRFGGPVTARRSPLRGARIRSRNTRRARTRTTC